MKCLKKYKKAFSLGFQSSVEYRWNFAFGFLSCVFTLVIQFFMWTGIFNSSDSKLVYGYTYSQMLIYSLFAALTSKLISGGFEYGILDDIKNGGLSKFIVKPIGYLRYRLACFLGEKFFYAVVIFILIAIFDGVFRVIFDYKISVTVAVMFVLSVILSLLINFLIYSSLAAVSFWVTDAWALFVIFELVANALSGGIFPLDIFGKTLKAVFNFLPFQYTIYFSVNILTGKVDLNGIFSGLAVQILWIAIMLVVSNLIWRTGLRKYEAVGG